MPAREISTPIGTAPLFPVLLLATGGYIAWYAIHYWRDTAQKWPSDPLKSFLTGKGLPAPQPSPPLLGQVSTALASAATSGVAAGAAAGAAAAGVASGGTAQQILQQTAAGYGWGDGAEWQALQSLEMQEAGFNPLATNPSSGAFGIAQALGHGNGAATQGTHANEYGGYGLTDAQARAANSGDAGAQAIWMCNYIRDRYGDPKAAWAHEQANNWY